MKILIKNGFVVLKNSIVKTNILINNNLIHSIGNSISAENCTVFDAENLFILPGLVDCHVHFREPGFEHKETILSGSKAAAAGGVTTVCCMPNCNPVTDSVEALKFFNEKAKNALINVHPIAAITKNSAGHELVNFKQLAKFNAVGFSDDGNPLTNKNLMQKALILANELNLPIISHCEDLSISKNGLINFGEISKKLNVKGIKKESEFNFIKREIELSKLTNCPIHIAHVSCKESVDLIKKAKEDGVRITAETCPQYFMLTEQSLLTRNANFKINPPLRTEQDRLAIVEGIINKTIDCIVTDHAPHADFEKENFNSAPFGVIGLETSLACVLTSFYKTNKLTLNRISELMTGFACKLFNFKTGKIEEGFPADLIAVDVNESFVVNKNQFHSKSSNSPFIGKKLTGKVKLTICNGKIVYKD